MSTTIAIGIGAFLILLFAYFTYSVAGEAGKKEHILLRLVLVFFFLNMLILLSKSSVDNCHILVSNETAASSMTLYEYDEYCFPSDKTTASLFAKNISRLMYLFWAYIIVYLSYVVLKWKGILGKK